MIQIDIIQFVIQNNTRIGGGELEYSRPVDSVFLISFSSGRVFLFNYNTRTGVSEYNTWTGCEYNTWTGCKYNTRTGVGEYNTQMI